VRFTAFSTDSLISLLIATARFSQAYFCERRKQPDNRFEECGTPSMFKSGPKDGVQALTQFVDVRTRICLAPSLNANSREITAISTLHPRVHHWGSSGRDKRSRRCQSAAISLTDICRWSRRLGSLAVGKILSCFSRKGQNGELTRAAYAYIEGKAQDGWQC